MGLLVEDEPTSIFCVEPVVKKLGIVNRRQIAKDGREPLDYLEGVGELGDRLAFPLPGLAILDLKLPRVPGFEVLRQIRRKGETKNIVVVIVSSAVSDEDIAKAYALGASAYLVKPLHLEELQEIVRAIKDFRLTHHHLPSRAGPGQSLSGPASAAG